MTLALGEGGGVGSGCGGTDGGADVGAGAGSGVCFGSGVGGEVDVTACSPTGVDVRGISSMVTEVSG